MSESPRVQPYRHEGATALAKEFAALHRRIDNLQRSLGAGLIIDGRTGDLVVPGRRNIRLGSDGDGKGALFTSSFNGEDFGTPGTAGNYFGDDGAVLNDLYLRPGSLGNDLLTSPVDPIAAYDLVTNFALSTSLTNIRTKNIPVPAGFTKAAVALTVRVYAINNSAGLDYLYSQANVNGFNGLALPVAATNAGGSCMNVSTFSAVLEGAALGSTLSLQIAAKTAFGAWSANASNAADLSASIAWYR